MKIIFMGTPDFAEVSLEALYNEKSIDIIGVVTNTDKANLRGKKIKYSPVKEFSLKNNLKLFQPEKIRNNTDFINEIKELKPDLLIVVAYGKILPKEILEIPKYGAINVHGSILPKYRGAAPIQRAVLNGDKETGVTTMFMDENMDTGDIILKEKIKIGINQTTGEVWDELSKIGASLLIKTIEKIENFVNENKNISQEELKEKLNVEKQNEKDATVAKMLNKEMSLIDWNKTSFEIHNLIRGLNPIMGAYSYINGKKIKFWKDEIISEKEILDSFKDYKNGEIIYANKKDGLIIRTSDGALRILEVQAQNGKKMDIKSFLNGNKIEEKSICKNS